MGEMSVAVVRWTDREKKYKSDVHREPKTRRPRKRPALDIGPAVFAKEVTEGIKLGPVSATYVSQVTCPSLCAFRENGCYAEHGPLAMVTTKRLNKRATGLTAIEVAYQEAEAIDRLSGTRDLRLHVVGDCPTAEAAQILAAAAERFVHRGFARGKTVGVWTYTHAWRTVPRRAWGCISVIASCEKPEHVQQANWRGYAAALVVDAHRQRRRHERETIDILPCPEQTTTGVQCASCRLCLDADRLLTERITIGFSLHGDRAGLAKARRTLAQ